MPVEIDDFRISFFFFNFRKLKTKWPHVTLYFVTQQFQWQQVLSKRYIIGQGYQKSVDTL